MARCKKQPRTSTRLWVLERQAYQRAQRGPLAWISDSTGSPSTRFTHASVPYALVDGTPIAINWAGLISGNLLRPINLTEASINYQNYIYTATKPNGTYFGNFACLNWTSSSPVNGALVGYSPDANQWSYVSIINCADPKSLYCFEQ